VRTSPIDLFVSSLWEIELESHAAGDFTDRRFQILSVEIKDGD
jgi:hypothetical protein